ncbi:MAG: hypothetical protein AAGA30_18895 [Planctomycetota bacterium]
MPDPITPSKSRLATSQQLALGVSLGLMIGLLPKDNLLFAGLLVFLILSGASLVTGALACCTSSYMSSMTQAWAIYIGERLFQLDWFVALLVDFMQLPLAAWTKLDNALVTGELTIGICLFLPFYLVSYWLFQRYYSMLQTSLQESSLTTWIVGYPSTEEQIDS